MTNGYITVHRRMQKWHVSSKRPNVSMSFPSMHKVQQVCRLFIKVQSYGCFVTTGFESVLCKHTGRWNHHFSVCFRFKGAAPWYTVDLDLPPSKRWTDIITDKKNDVRWCSLFVFCFLERHPQNCVFLVFQMVSMIQAIRDLADAFVPSGKLIELVDRDLVSFGSILYIHSYLTHSNSDACSSSPWWSTPFLIRSMKRLRESHQCLVFLWVCRVVKNCIVMFYLYCWTLSEHLC